MQPRNMLPAGLAFAAALASIGAKAQDWPTRPVTMVVTFAAGGGDDVITAGNGLASLTQLTIDGGAGNDTLTGGDGNDTLAGGGGITLAVTGTSGDDSIEPPVAFWMLISTSVPMSTPSA